MSPSPNTIRSGTTSDCYLPVASSEKVRLGNLSIHCILVLTTKYSDQTGYTAGKKTSSAPLRSDLSSLDEVAHIAAIREALVMLDGQGDLLALISETDLRNTSRLLCRLRQTTERILQGTQHCEEPTLKDFRGQLEGTLSRWPFAFASYVHEVAGSTFERSSLITLCAQALDLCPPEKAKKALRAALHFACERIGELPSSRPANEKVRREPPLRKPDAAGYWSSFTQGQHRILLYCQTLARLHAASLVTAVDGPVRGRFWPLIAAPSGSGKTALVRRLAEVLGYEYLKIQRGDMVPLGGKGTATQFVILNTLVAQKRMLLIHWDELDKFIVPEGLAAPAQEWSAGLWSCLYACLDTAFNLGAYLALDPSDRAKPFDPAIKITEDYLKKRIRDAFHVGSGTWQSVFEQAAKPKPGFRVEHGASIVTSADLLRSRQISAELFLRFHAEIQIMNHPSAAEIQKLLETSGLRRLAAETGYEIQDDEIDFTSRGGFRALETLYTRMLIRQEENQLTELEGPGAES